MVRKTIMESQSDVFYHYLIFDNTCPPYRMNESYQLSINQQTIELINQSVSQSSTSII